SAAPASPAPAASPPAMPLPGPPEQRPSSAAFPPAPHRLPFRRLRRHCCCLPPPLPGGHHLRCRLRSYTILGWKTWLYIAQRKDLKRGKKMNFSNDLPNPGQSSFSRPACSARRRVAPSSRLSMLVISSTAAGMGARPFIEVNTSISWLCSSNTLALICSASSPSKLSSQRELGGTSSPTCSYNQVRLSASPACAR